MPDTNQRVLHGNQQAEQVLDLMASSGLIVVRLPLRSTNGLRVVNELCGVDFRKMILNAFAQFYRDTELATRFQSALVEIDAEKRTIILTHVRLKHRRKDLPREVHNIRVY